jgi:predicted dinucleotide-binding enzyme
MKIAVLGTGMVGQAIAGRFAELGHDVTVGTRDVDATLGKTAPDRMGNPAFATWVATRPDVRLATFAEAAAGSELLVNATNGSVSIDALRTVDDADLAGKVLIDIANPLDYSQGFPPTLFVKDTDSLGEQIQAAFPELKVVKALNTLTAPLMANPAQLTAEHSVFVAGNDADAKRTVGDILASFGHTDVIDVGDISSARGTEMYLPLWLRLMGALNTPYFNVKVVR